MLVSRCSVFFSFEALKHVLSQPVSVSRVVNSTTHLCAIVMLSIWSLAALILSIDQSHSQKARRAFAKPPPIGQHLELPDGRKIHAIIEGQVCFNMSFSLAALLAEQVGVCLLRRDLNDQPHLLSAPPHHHRVR